MIRTGALVGAVTLLGLLASCGGEAPPAVAQSTSEIIGGTVDNGDPAVALIFLQDANGNGWGLCSGSLIGRRTILTAAHCADGNVADPTMPYDPNTNPYLTKHTVAFATGFDGNTGTWNQLISMHDVVAVSVHPQWNGDPGNGGDVALMLLANGPANITPLEINRTSLSGSYVGQTVRLVGFGATSGSSTSNAGTKEQTQSRVSAVYSGPPLLEYGSSTHNTCHGDSGGPNLLNIGGREVVAGITSFGDAYCQQYGDGTRVDAYVSFIDSFIAAHESLGSPCGRGSDCPSGFCADGVCCNTACGNSSMGDCQACSVAAGAPSDGTCSPVANGTACNDHDTCTGGDSCQNGQCTPATTLTCMPLDECHQAGICTSATQCTNPTVADGTPCTGGSCRAGVCVRQGGQDAGNPVDDAGAADPDAGSTDTPAGDGGGNANDAGGANDGGAGGHSPGCACRATTSGARAAGGPGAWALLAGALALGATRRRRAGGA